MIDLTRAVVVHPAELSRPEASAVAMLVDEVEQRTRIRWLAVAELPPGGPAVVLGRADGPAEGYTIRSGDGVVQVLGNDPRGVLFGVGRLLRMLRMDRDRVGLEDGLELASAPCYPLRGHQLGYRPKTNSYDGWSLPLWEQYLRDLAVFGCNAIELIPPRSDDADDSPHFPLPPLAMMTGMARLCDDYGMDVWVWYPALDADYTDPATVAAARREWEEVFTALPRLDAVFVPGGDPGHTAPRLLMALLAEQAETLRRNHPGAGMWLSPQGFTAAWLDELLAILRDERPAWLTGIVFGPQVRMGLAELRERVPEAYPIRHYPDITHCRQCQFPVPDWDLAFALTEAREPINPRPLAMASTFRRLQAHTIGFITYSEGCNDDVNKAVWSALGWDPNVDVTDILRDYSRYFIGDRYAETFAQGLLALERGWSGPLLGNAAVDTTLLQFRALEREAAPREKLNWRFQQALYRAYYDAYTRRRLVYETELEEHARDLLRNAIATGSLAAMAAAEAVLDRAVSERVGTDLRARIFELAEALFQSIRMQLSVERYQAIDVGRGANLDTVDVPLNNRLWLKQRFAAFCELPAEAERLRAIGEMLDWADPGPGGHYDNLGVAGRQPHLVPGAGCDADPDFRATPLTGFGWHPEGPTSWWTHAQTLYDHSLRLRYDGLDPTATYRLKLVYAGDSQRVKIRLVANETIEVHPLIDKPSPIAPLEFDLPHAATQSGTLTLSWTRDPGAGGNGRGCQVAEVWLIRG